LDDSAQSLAAAEPVPDTGASGSGAAPEPAGADSGSSRRITYFGVFDFMPPAEIAREEIARNENAEDLPAAETIPVVEPEPVTPRSRVRRNLDGETPTQRHAQLRTRVQTLQKQITGAERAHERALRQMALARMTEQQERLDTYLAQARFSLARLLDPAVADNTGP
ncbi:MAG: hypothetical protein ACRESV_10320, partial [Nevskiales bacterium]